MVISYTSCLPTTPGAISGITSICAGGSGTYTIAPVSGATSYTWTLPSGWSGTSTTESIELTTGATSGTISVTAENACGSSTAQTLDVTVNALPQVSFDLAQSIVCNDLGQIIVLNTGTPTGGTYSGPGVSGNTLVTSSLDVGSYVLAYDYTDGAGCAGSDTANIEVVVCTSIEDLNGATPVAIYPNPFNNTVYVAVEGRTGVCTATVTDVQGKEIQSIRFDASSRNAQLTMEDLEQGVYFVRVSFNGRLIAVNKLLHLD